MKESRKKGFKRTLITLMILAVPIVSAQPISNLQGSAYFPHISKIIRMPEVRPPVRPVPVYNGTASWYSETDPGIQPQTANGEIFDDSKLTCASWHFPFGTSLKVKNEANGKSVVCRVNDRGPAKRLNRLIDLTKTAFSRIAPAHKGLIRVSVTRVGE